ncbi:unnamed protein product [Leptidea sinapis]|uniref:Uncharacterized protein n=1 Tax=Leptidea sinapis TaxID=189913 RepID=A0A5E4R3W8_9NEOP|nr:unnamed protein product [Leptidea sinapis]
MYIIKVLTAVLLVTVVNAEKKIELEDIEEDNLKSEREKDFEKSGNHVQGPSGGSGLGVIPLEYVKNGYLRYYEAQTAQPRYVQQYAVTEAPERPPSGEPHGYGQTQPAMVGYLSNIPMQLYFVPQFYNEPAEQASNSQHAAQYRPAQSGYSNSPDDTQHHNNNVVPTFVAPTGNTYPQQYSTPVGYFSYNQPHLPSAHASVTPVIAYPNAQYPSPIPTPPIKSYPENTQFADTNNVDDDKYVQHVQHQEYPRYYNSRVPSREEYDYRGTVNKLPHPNPLLLNPQPPHLSHIPKALPIYRPLTKPIYAAGGALIANTFTPRPNEAYGVPFKRRPNSLLDSYVPSSLQLEYMKRGYTKDPLSAYEALSSGRNLHQVYPMPRYYERGFLPNQMYHTAAGGITYGYHKRTPKIDKTTKKK